MDNGTKLAIFMDTLGDGVDAEVAKSVLEVHGWDLEVAISTMTGGEPVAPAGRSQPTEPRAPMATGYTDTLMAPVDRRQEQEERRRIAYEKKEAEELAVVQQAETEARRREDNEQQAQQQRAQAERHAMELRQKKRARELADARLQADPEALRQHEERQRAEAEAEARKKQIEEDRRRREEAKAEAEERKKAEEGDLIARRRSEKEEEDLRREKSEAEVRARKNSGEDLNKDKASDEVSQAIQTLRRNYKESDPVGLVTCLQTVRKYIDNLIRNPGEQKFQRINCENTAFRTRVAAFEGAIALLKACGFSESSEGHLAVTPEFAKSKGPGLWNVLTKVDFVISDAQAKADALLKERAAT